MPLAGVNFWPSSLHWSGVTSWRALNYPSLYRLITKNLEYIQTAKRLNQRQALWVLSFGWFNFTLSYCSGSKNRKPDALSSQFHPGKEESVLERILPSFVMVKAFHFDIEGESSKLLPTYQFLMAVRGEGYSCPMTSVPKS